MDTDIKKTKLDKYDCATRTGASKYNDYEELDCTDCIPFGGSGTHDLILRNPGAKLLLKGWQVQEVENLLDWINEDDRITEKPSITYDVIVNTCPDCHSESLGYVPMSKVLVRTRLCLDCGHEWTDNE